ncbi:MAG: hypothetical protein AB7P02_08460 [Alphaproteobacteria bacterium]
MSIVVVTAWDVPDGSLLAGLLGSLVLHTSTRDMPVRVLVPAGATPAVPHPTIALADGESVEMARTRLPDLVPGFDRYLWLDPSTWIADGAAPAALADACGDGALAAVFELDRSYRIFRSDRPPWTRYALLYNALYDRPTARRMWMRPFIDGGVLALAAGAPHWEAWRRALDRIQPDVEAPQPFSRADAALNVAVVLERLALRPLPATWNWLCHFERPAWQGRLVDPEPPHDPIGIVHLSARSRDLTMPLADPDGGDWHSTLRFPLTVERGKPPRAGAEATIADADADAA